MSIRQDPRAAFCLLAPCADPRGDGGKSETWRCLEQLKAEGMSMLVVDKNLKSLLPLADRHYIVEKGRIVWSGNSSALAADPRVHHQYLGI